MRRYSVLISVVLIVIGAAFSQTACMDSGACPAGWLKNATGDCVDPNNLVADGDEGNNVLNPCPEGWTLNANGYCTQIEGSDGDTSDGDLTDGDTTDGDVTDGDATDGDTTDGDTPAPCVTDAGCEIGHICHSQISGGICLPACSTLDECRHYDPASFCNAEQRCVPNSGSTTCTSDAQCRYLEVCHYAINDGTCAEPCTTVGDCNKFGIQYVCNAGGRCVEQSVIENCSLDEDCLIGEICHLQYDGGTCKSPCLRDSECVDEEHLEFFCNALSQCAPTPTTDGCQSDAECGIGDVCHNELDENGLCMAPCSENGECSAIDSGYWCSSQQRCVRRPTNPGCESDDDCSINNVCHLEASDDGVCAPPCTSSEDCRLINPDLACNAEFHCVPDIVTDGDVTDGDVTDGDVTDGDVTDGDVTDGDVTDGDVTDGDVEDCIEIYQGGAYILNVLTSNLTVRAKRDGGTYLDPSSKSSIHLRDNESGSQFAIHSNFSDGSSLPAVEIIQGNYNIVAQNKLGQRETVVENVQIVEDMTVDVPFPFHTITIHLRKNGSAFPTLENTFLGEIRLFDRSARRTHVIAETGGALSDFNVNVFTSSYDIIFAGYLSNSDNSYQEVTLLTDDRVASDKEYTFDLKTATLTGEILINGESISELEEDRGEVWAIDAAKGDRFRFWSLGDDSPGGFSREIVKGTYTIGYTPPEFNGSQYLWRDLENNYEWNANQTDLMINIPRVKIDGTVIAAEDPLADHTFLDRGKIILIDQATNESFDFVQLGTEGAVAYEKWIGPGTYSLKFEGALIDDEWFVGRSYPPSVHKVVFQTDVVLDRSKTLNINLPLLVMSGSVTKNGQPLGFSVNGEYITLRMANTSDDIPILHFGNWDGLGYAATVFPGNYQMRYSGSTLMGRFQNFYLYEELMVSEDSLVFDVDVQARTADITVTANGGTDTLKQLLDDGTFTAAEIHVVDETIRNRTTGSTEMTENGKFELERSVGSYTFLLRTAQGDTYQEKPLIKEFELQNNEDLNFDVDLTAFSIQVLKNGQPMPEAGNGFSRGDIVFRTAEDYQVVVSYDLLVEGEVLGVVTTWPYKYSTYLSVGYGDAFPYQQWKYMDCVNVNSR